MHAYVTAAPPEDCVAVESEPDSERVDTCWYARDVYALVAAPGLPPHVASELRAWARTLDANVRRRRPFMLEVSGDGRTAYVFAPSPLRRVPAWWRDAVESWARTHGGGSPTVRRG